MRVKGALHRRGGRRCVLLTLVVAVAAGCSSSVSPEVDRALQLGDKYLAEGNRKKAFAAYTKAAKLDPYCKKAFVCRGMLYNEVGKPEKALREFTKAIKIDPNDSYPYEQRALIYRNALDDPAKAEADEERAFQIRQQQREKVRQSQKRKRGR